MERRASWSRSRRRSSRPSPGSRSTSRRSWPAAQRREPPAGRRAAPGRRVSEQRGGVLLDTLDRIGDAAPDPRAALSFSPARRRTRAGRDRARAGGRCGGAALGVRAAKGCFVAERVCPATSSIRGARNPGDLATEPGRAYPLLGANRAERASHAQVRILGRSRVSAGSRSAAGTASRAAPGRSRAAAGSGRRAMQARPGGELAAGVLRASPGDPGVPLADRGRFDALNLALHGLWPEPRDNVYCGVSRDERAADEAGRGGRAAGARAERAYAGRPRGWSCPAHAPALHRHEWPKHGTCYGTSAEEYFADALQLTAELNASPVRALFAARIGGRVTAPEVRAAVDEAFGAGAGARVALACADGLVTEPGSACAARSTRPPASPTSSPPRPAEPGCPAGRIDRRLRPAEPARPERCRRGGEARPVAEGGEDEEGHDVDDLDHRVDRGAGGVLRASHGVAGDRGLVGLGALAAVVAVLDELLAVVPRRRRPRSSRSRRRSR